MRIFAAGILCAVAISACNSGLKTNRDAGRDDGPDRPPAQADGAPCQGIDKPDVDCAYGSPSYVCLQDGGGSSWSYTCPERPRDAASMETGAGDTRATSDVGPDCAAIAQRLAAGMQAQVGGCTAVVRLDYTNLTILSYAFVCGKYAVTDEAAARKSATAAAVFPYTSGAGTGKLMTEANPTDQWVFYTSPSDFGGVAAVSDRTGLATFAATIVWSGTGEILVPKSFNTDELGRGCTPPSPSPVRGINLAGGEAQPRFDEAAAVVRSTALPAAFSMWGGSFDAVVLVYPRTVGGFVASTAEYIVLLDGGWLE